MNIVNGGSFVTPWSGSGGSFVGTPTSGIHTNNFDAGIPIDRAFGATPMVSPTANPINSVASTPINHSITDYQKAYDAYTHNRPDLAPSDISFNQSVIGRTGANPNPITPTNNSILGSFTPTDLANNAKWVNQQNVINAQNTANNWNTSQDWFNTHPIHMPTSGNLSDPYLFAGSVGGRTIPNYTSVDINGNVQNPSQAFDVITGGVSTRTILNQNQLNNIWTQESKSPTPLTAPSGWSPSGYDALNYLQTGTIQAQNTPAVTQLSKQGLNVTPIQLNNIWTQEKGSPTPLTAPQGWTPLNQDVKNYLATGFINQSAASNAPVSNLGTFFSTPSVKVPSMQTNVPNVPSINVPNMNNVMPINIPQISNQNMNMSGIQGSTPVNMRNMLGLDQTWW
jgi:hypothetical protein